MEPNITEDEHQIIVTGIHAKELLNHPTFAAVVNELETQIKDSILKTPIADHFVRERLYMLFKALENLINILSASASLVDTVEPVHSGIAPAADLEVTDLSTNPIED